MGNTLKQKLFEMGATLHREIKGDKIVGILESKPYSMMDKVYMYSTNEIYGQKGFDEYLIECSKVLDDLDNTEKYVLKFIHYDHYADGTMVVSLYEDEELYYLDSKYFQGYEDNLYTLIERNNFILVELTPEIKKWFKDVEVREIKDVKLKKLDWIKTMTLAHLLSKLPKVEVPTENRGIANLLGVKSATYFIHEDKEIVVTLKDNHGNKTKYTKAELLIEHGSWNEVWTRMIVRAMDCDLKDTWIRQGDLSAMLGYGLDNENDGVWYYVGEDGVQFKITRDGYMVNYDPFELLGQQIY